MIAQKICDENELDAKDEQANQEIEAAIDFAESSPDPSENVLYEKIYAELPWEE